LALQRRRGKLQWHVHIRPGIDSGFEQGEKSCFLSTSIRAAVAV